MTITYISLSRETLKLLLNIPNILSCNKINLLQKQQFVDYLKSVPTDNIMKYKKKTNPNKSHSGNFVIQNENQRFKMMFNIFTFRLYLQNHDHKNKNISHTSSVEIKLVKSYKRYNQGKYVTIKMLMTE